MKSGKNIIQEQTKKYSLLLLSFFLTLLTGFSGKLAFCNAAYAVGPSGMYPYSVSLLFSGHPELSYLAAALFLAV